MRGFVILDDPFAIKDAITEEDREKIFDHYKDAATTIVCKRDLIDAIFDFQDSLPFTSHELKLIGSVVGGTFMFEEGDKLIYGSHTFPVHRITVPRSNASNFLNAMYSAAKSAPFSD